MPRSEPKIETLHFSNAERMRYVLCKGRGFKVNKYQCGNGKIPKFPHLTVKKISKKVLMLLLFVPKVLKAFKQTD